MVRSVAVRREAMLILGRVQAARGRGRRRWCGRVVVEGLLAVPQAGAAEDAFLAIEQRDAARPRRERLAGAHLDAELGGAALAEIGIQECHVVGVSRRRLHLAAYQQRVLLGHQQLAVKGNGRPAAAVHQRIMHCHAS